jgi:DNA-binding NarL/FixJ family response regulator
MVPASMEQPGTSFASIIRLVLADDHPIVLAGLEQLFATEPGFVVVATAATGSETLTAVAEHRPDVLVLDLRMPDLGGIDVVRQLQQERSATRVVVLTASESDEVIEAIRIGVQGVVLKDMAPALLVRCVRAVHRGDKWIEKVLATRALDRLLARRSAEQDVAVLTRRELEVAQLVAQGFSNKAVAARMLITEGTVKLHVHHVYGKLGVDGRMSLAALLRRKGLV